MKRALVTLPLLVLACGPARPPQPTVLTGLVDATEIDVASKVPGRVRGLAVREGDHVVAGARLATVESEEIAAKIDQATAAIAAAQAKLRLAEAGARPEEKEAARQALEAARHQLDLADKMYQRAASLVADNAIPKAQFDDAESKLNLARDQVAMAQARYDQVRKGARSEEIDALRALVQQGEGVLSEVEVYRKETTQTAPIAGEVAKIVLHEGELAATGYPILTLVDLDDVWASFAVREDLLRGLTVGAEIQVQLPALDKTVPMRVYAIAPLGDFATWRATSDRGGFDLKSFEVKARPTAPVPGLRPGMTARWAME
jgi:HlyD family secretion protein